MSTTSSSPASLASSSNEPSRTRAISSHDQKNARPSPHGSEQAQAHSVVNHSSDHKPQTHESATDKLRQQSERIDQMLEEFERSAQRASKLVKPSDVSDPPGPPEIQRRMIEAAAVDLPGLRALANVHQHENENPQTPKNDGTSKLDVIV